MKLSENITKKKKSVSNDKSKISEDKIKVKLNSESIKLKKRKKETEHTENNKMVQNNTDNVKKRIKSLPDTKKSKKLKLDSDTTAKKSKLTATENVTNIKKSRKRIKSEIKENGDNVQDLSKDHILQCIKAIFHLTEEQVKDSNVLFSDESQPIFMQVNCIRIPKVSRRQIRFLLPYSVVSSEDDIALFVCDLERGRRKDYEPTVNHYKELLEKCGCTIIKDVIPMNQLKTEYDQFELKRKLIASYDHFLVDGRIAGHVSHLLGKMFYNKRKLPTSIKMDKKDLKSEIDYALRKTSMRVDSLVDTHLIQVANTSMKKQQILENVLAVCDHLINVYPGGWSNIRAIRLKTPLGPGLPIYMTLKNKNTVVIPVVEPKRPKAYHNVEGELTTLSSNVNVIVTPEGDVKLKELSSIKSEDNENKENEEDKEEEKEESIEKNK